MIDSKPIRNAIRAASRILLLPLLSLALADSVFASDGVLEINQTCAMETGCFAGDTPGFPVTVTTPGTSYRLTSRLIIPNAVTSAIEIDTHDVGIDLNGFSIILSFCEGATTDCTPLAGTGSGIVSTSVLHRGLSVENGSIVGMGSYGVSLGIQAEVTNVSVRWNRLDGISTGSSSVVSGSTAHENGRDGINAASGSTISNCTAFQNGSDGIEGDLGTVIIGNASYDNGDSTSPSADDGIQCGDGCIVRANTMRGNSGYGLNLSGSGSAYSDNVVTLNSTGTVTGSGSANSRGGNLCTGTGTGSAFCP
jgi:hypothetical protein